MNGQQVIFLKHPICMWYTKPLAVGNTVTITWSMVRMTILTTDIVRIIIKRSALQTVDGGPFKGKRLQKMKPSSFGLIAVFLRHAPDSQLFHDNIFERLRCFLNSLDLSVCEDQAIGTSKGILKSLRLL